MIPCLNNATSGAASFEGFLQAAQVAGFGAVEVGVAQMQEYAQAHSAGVLRQAFDARGLVPGSGGLPVNWQGAEEQYQSDLAALPARLDLCREVGLTRLCTWVSPRWNVPYAQATAFCTERLGPVADTLARWDMLFGLEFVGPQDNCIDRPFKFINSLPEMMHFIDKLGRDNVGMLVDAYHLYVGESSPADLAAVPAKRIVQFHINDAYPGIPRPQLKDLKRLLPGEGTIPLVPMLLALRETGYDWTVSIETFSDAVKALGPVAAAKKAKAALDGLLGAL